MDEKQTIRKSRVMLFLISQCITLFGSTLVQMAIVWYVTIDPDLVGSVGRGLYRMLLSAAVFDFFCGRRMGGPSQPEKADPRSRFDDRFCDLSDGIGNAAYHG